jgi:proton glutamate symport protein
MRFFWLALVALGLGTKRHWHILLAIVMGVILGLTLSGPQYEGLHVIFEAFAEIFIRLINMIVVPLVVSSLIVGVSSLGDSRQIGRMGGKVVTMFLSLMLIASLLGAGLALTFQPGNSLQNMISNQQAALTQNTVTVDKDMAISSPLNSGTVLDNATPLTQATQQRKAEGISRISQPMPSLKTLFFNMIPQNPLGSLAKAELVPVIIFTLVFGLAIACIGEAGKPLISIFEAIFTATMKITDWVMILSVPGIFCLTFMTVATAGPDIFLKLAPYTMVIMLGLLLQVFVVLPLMLKFMAKVSFVNLYRAISEAIMVAFGTASSSATLPITMACCERRAGISNRIASFVLPTGVTINKTGTTILEVVAVIFLMQAYGIHMEPYMLVLTILFSIIASIGTAGVPSGGLLTIAIVFNSLGLNSLQFTGGLAMLWAIDRVLDMCRTVVNVISSCAVATVVASHEGELNRDLLNSRDAWLDVVKP